ncbi:MAG: acetyl-CoA synthase subunit gamma, partial [Deltaproteobacteria bacterium]
PVPKDPVFVTANYKLSFDHLRSSLEGRSCWLLVLDTKGVNVWCAAGKGTFGTDELVERIRTSGLERVVEHRTVIVPQLGASGVAAHQVRRRSGFRVVFGPVRAADLQEFMDAGMKATAEMRTKRFPLAERVAVIGVELVHVLRYFPLLAAAVFFLAGLGFSESYWHAAALHGGYGIAALVLAVFAGVILTPVLLPWLAGPAFSAKGLQAALLAEVPLLVMRPAKVGIVEATGWLLAGLSFASFLAMNFTGASTYTSLSGVRKEIRLSVPLQIAGAACGLVLVAIAAATG